VELWGPHMNIGGGKRLGESCPLVSGGRVLAGRLGWAFVISLVGLTISTDDINGSEDMHLLVILVLGICSWHIRLVPRTEREIFGSFNQNIVAVEPDWNPVTLSTRTFPRYSTDIVVPVPTCAHTGL
jgi:hypothetical protein